MKRIALALGLSAFALFLAASPPAQAANVAFAPLSRSYSPPPLGRRQGWLTISNRDWYSYALRVDGGKLFLYRGDSGFGGMVIPSGTTMSIALEKDTYDLYGSNPDKLKVRVREGRTTTLSLEPFGYSGNTGLVGVVNDGERVRNGTLFDSYATTVVVPQQPVIIQEQRPIIVSPPPPPPPVIVHRPPHRPPPPPPPPPRRPGYGPGYRPGGPGHRPPPPSHNRPHGGRDDGWSIVFGIGKR